jgi:ElaB/YqjD/DUF883 family membrane-anchored ribosome-binding protein
MDPAASPQGSSGKPKKKRQSKKAKLSIKVASVPEDENRQSAEALGQKVKNTKNTFEAVRSYVGQKPARGLLLALAIGIVAGSICRD